MTTKPDKQNLARLTQVEEHAAEGDAAVLKRPFVEPEVSFPVDVLEATTFFQEADSGITP